MSTITTINATDTITSSRTVINTNFSNLNTDKIETSTLDTDTSLSANSDSKIPTQKAVKAYVDTGGNSNASETTRGIVEEATDAEVTAGTATGGTGAKLFITPAKLRSSGIIKFGGTGADGALSISSGTTTIDCANAATVVKNYTSIAITGTGKLAFSNPNTNGTVVILKSQGNVTLTSSSTPMLDCSGIGAAGGAAVGPTGSSQAGNSGSNSYSFATISNGGATANVSGAADGTAGTAASTNYTNSSPTIYTGKYPFIIGGAGGSSGGVVGGVASTSTSGAGGNGGGGLILECGGALNFTTANGISVAGANGGNGARNTGANGGAGGGGGGGGGVCIVLYNTLTANSGTITITGGTGGSQAFTGGNGAGGGSLRSAGSGSSGGTGYSVVTSNTELS